MSVRISLCQVCGVRPPAMRDIPCCFDCWPGGPVTPPPCRRCGSTKDYFMSGLCAHCHHHAPGPKTPLWESPGKLRRRPVTVASCPDCDAWGVTARYGWICTACKSHRDVDGPPADCATCDRHVPLGPGGSCRMCHKQRHHTAQQLGVRPGAVTLVEANRHGQQLFFAGMHRLNGGRWRYQRKTSRPDRSAVLALLRPATHQQLLAFDLPHDLRAAMWDRFLPPPDPLLEAAFHEFVRDHARVHGWAIGKTATVQRAIRILLGIQDTPGAAIHASDVALLTRIKHSAAVVADVLTAAGMLHEDREPAVVRWFTTATADLPEPMRAELAAWFDVMRNGNPTPPRSRPRAESTLRSQFSFALPALTRWATDESMRYDSLKQVSRVDVLAVLPASGAARNAMAQSLRSIFRALRARKLVFGNPMFRIHVPAPQQQIPTLPDLVRLRAALDAPDPATALIAALLAYHAVRVHQLRDLRLTDIHDGRLHINGPGPDEQTILLADPVRARLRTYLDHRAATWPTTINPYLFVNVRSAAHTRPVNGGWAHTQLGMSGQQIRLDRIFYEAVSTGGDLRALADMFGLSIASAARYASIVDKAQPAPSAS